MAGSDKKIRKNNDISNAVNSSVGGIFIIFMTGANSCGAETRLIDLRCRNYCNGALAGMKYTSLKISGFRK